MRFAEPLAEARQQAERGAGTADRMLQPDQRTGRHRDQFGRAGERGGQGLGKLSASRAARA